MYLTFWILGFHMHIALLKRSREELLFNVHIKIDCEKSTNLIAYFGSLFPYQKQNKKGRIEPRIEPLYF